MRKFKLIFLIFFLIYLYAPFFQVLAWKNSSYAYNNIDYSYEDDYGTHDLLADAALQALLEDDESSWTWLNDPNRKKIFLLGTEAPDNSKVKVTLDGKEVEGFGDTTKHHIYFNQDGTISNNEDDSALRAKSCGDLADSYIEDNKFDLAAFYLGAMTHYIADMSIYAHVAENNVDPYYTDFDEHHSEVEAYVLSRTNNYQDMEEFFKIDDNIKIDSDLKPYDAAKNLAWNTFKDPNPSESITRDAKWLNDNFFTDWADKYEDRDDESATRQLYYDRIEENLNNAIEAIASAMAYVGGIKNATPSYSISIVLIISGLSILSLILIVYKKRV
ncbi:MAG: hypothetical protein ACTSQS_04975 [Promethearchaeota archaeon]